MSLPKKVTCPYCMEEFKNPLIKDGRHRAFKDKDGSMKDLPEDACDHCHKRIPKDYLYGKVRTLYVYFIGPVGVGKTRLIGNMILESERKFGKRGVLRDWRVAPNPNPYPDPKKGKTINDNEWYDFYANYAKDRNDSKVQGTGINEIGEYPMVLYKLGSFGSMLSFRKETVYLALADAMGEWFTFEKLPANMQDPFSGMPSKVQDGYKKRFSKADAIVLVLEPGHIPGLYSSYDKDENGELVIRKTKTDIEKILDYSQLMFGKRFQKVPLAITLSKFDRFYVSKNSVAQNFLKYFEKSVSNWDNETDFERDDIHKITAVNEGLKAAILNSTELDSRARKNILEIISSYPYASLFAVSSTGKGGLSGLDTENELKPQHILDPLVWILWQYGYLGSKLFI